MHLFFEWMKIMLISNIRYYDTFLNHLTFHYIEILIFNLFSYNQTKCTRVYMRISRLCIY